MAGKLFLCPFPPKNHLFRTRKLKDLSDISPILPKPQTMQCSSSECPPQQGSYQEEQSAWINLCWQPQASPLFRGAFRPQPHLYLATYLSIVTL